MSNQANLLHWRRKVMKLSVAKRQTTTECLSLTWTTNKRGLRSKKTAEKGLDEDPTLDNLLGQANLEHARGRTKEAMAILFEVVKLAPYHVQTYKELSDLYSEVGQKEKSFEFKMLAALLNTKTTAEEWEEIAESAKSFNRLELAVACLAKAIRCDPENWVYYEKRIQILDSTGETDLAMKTRLQAAQSINCQTSQVNFVWIDKLIKTAADYYCTLKDEERATEALETFILRSRQFGRPIDFEHLALLGMWIGKGRFEDSAKSILAMHNELIQAVDGDGISAMTAANRRLASGTREARPRRKTAAENTEAKTQANISAFGQFLQQIQLSPLSHHRRARARERSGASEASVA
uniref:TPR_REGION domain-containing protein n=1 Tax=Globodera pallida TaxID=36090 RepID=A0A183C0L6_GLOPA